MATREQETPLHIDTIVQTASTQGYPRILTLCAQPPPSAAPSPSVANTMLIGNVASAIDLSAAARETIHSTPSAKASRLVIRCFGEWVGSAAFTRAFTHDARQSCVCATCGQQRSKEEPLNPVMPKTKSSRTSGGSAQVPCSLWGYIWLFSPAWREHAIFFFFSLPGCPSVSESLL